MTRSRIAPKPATYYGREGFLEATAEWTGGFSDWSVIPEEFIDAGSSVLVGVRQIARGEGSGILVEGEFWFVFEIRSSKLSKLSIYSRRTDALKKRCCRRPSRMTASRST
jgi:hypothetical protein